MERHNLNTICVSPSVAGVGLSAVLSLIRRGHNNGRREEQTTRKIESDASDGDEKARRKHKSQTELAKLKGMSFCFQCIGTAYTRESRILSSLHIIILVVGRYRYRDRYINRYIHAIHWVHICSRTRDCTCGRIAYACIYIYRWKPGNDLRQSNSQGHSTNINVYTQTHTHTPLLTYSVRALCTCTCSTHKV